MQCNLFRGLLLERERRIRETGIRAHGILMQAAGRNVAPYLKRLIGPWILLLNDSSRSCRTLASEALQKSIPQQKHLATWVFCKEEILSYISDRLDQTQQSLCQYRPILHIHHTMLIVSCRSSIYSKRNRSQRYLRRKHGQLLVIAQFSSEHITKQ